MIVRPISQSGLTKVIFNLHHSSKHSRFNLYMYETIFSYPLFLVIPPKQNNHLG